MERYLFFNSSQNDVRQYQAGDFAWYFGNVLKSGLIHTDGVPELQVKCQGTDLRTYVEAGKAIIQGHAYENTSDLYLEHALPEATMDRIDRIVLRLDKRNQSRFIKLFVLQGDPAANPAAPTLQRDEFIHELSLAQIRVRANTSALNPADLVDERLDEDLCGLVSVQNMGFAPLDRGVPSGLISMWSGSYSEIPSGWYLCDGTNGTPDLQDRFILGASNEAQIGEKGGSNTVTIGVTVTHDHSIKVQNSYDHAGYGFTTTSSTHNASFDNRPKFYKLAFIMKA